MERNQKATRGSKMNIWATDKMTCFSKRTWEIWAGPKSLHTERWAALPKEVSRLFARLEAGMFVQHLRPTALREKGLTLVMDTGLWGGGAIPC